MNAKQLCIVRLVEERDKRKITHFSNEHIKCILFCSNIFRSQWIWNENHFHSKFDRKRNKIQNVMNVFFFFLPTMSKRTGFTSFRLLKLKQFSFLFPRPPPSSHPVESRKHLILLVCNNLKITFSHFCKIWHFNVLNIWWAITDVVMEEKNWGNVVND